MKTQELFEQEEWEDYTKQSLAAELNWYIEEDTFWYKDMGIDPLPPGYPIKPLAISDTMLKEFNDVMSGLTGDYESGQMSEDSLETERRYLYVDLINNILKIDWEAHLNKLERRSEVARRRQEI